MMMQKIFVITLLAMFVSGASSCQRKKEDLFKQVDADVWAHDQLPPEICEQHPELKEGLGIYRKVRCTDASRVAGLCGPEDKHYEEVIPYCDPEIKKHMGMRSSQFKKWIDLAKQQIDECL